ncbi:OLC1v1000569C1 [Oldenlandia corymbosa var. corymbosa]|uniref:OLC1v1000569C1 n=1 Tax=Oldenlandia corymbosa var. corymbosa TaxID=529605 RepID=A0AAV1D3I9_OLDCO|nr:OLC1v1000569C1 [Oldenlandia corymbosa var. corymbosa]
MGSFLSGIVLPLLLFAASTLNWSIVSLVDLLTSLVLLACLQGSYRWKHVVQWNIIMLSGGVILLNAFFHITMAIKGGWVVPDAPWAKLFGFISDKPESSAGVYFLLIHALIAMVAMTELHRNKYSPDISGEFYSQDSDLPPGSKDAVHFRILCYFLLPIVQLVHGISHPSWVSLPYFFCSCIGLARWSIKSNFLGLFWCWRFLLVYAGFNIIFLYVYQLPIEFSATFQQSADLVGLYKFSAKSDWPELCSGVSLLLFYFMLSRVRCDLMETSEIVSVRQTGLIEQLLPKTNSFVTYHLRSSAMHANIVESEALLWKFTINFFTYGFPVCLFAYSFWSFQFASLCSFPILAYVGYVVYSIPSIFHLHHLNGLLLVFILFWATCTYVFNIIFSLLNKKLEKDMAMWEALGLWNYSQPGLFLLAQFFPAILLAIGNVVNGMVFSYLVDGDGQPKYRNLSSYEKEEKSVYVIAIVAWGFRKSSRAIVLVLLLFISLKPGFVPAAYMVFFMIYLLSHAISRELRQSLILLCEIHFAVLFSLQLNVISRFLQDKGSVAAEIFSWSGLLESHSSVDFLKIGGLASFCAIQNHGFDILCSFSTIVQYTPFPPFGWRLWKAGLNKRVLLSVYAMISSGNKYDNSVHERRTALYLSAMGQKFLYAYRACGTYIVCLTVLLTVYLVRPNYTSFGYLFFLLLWMSARQLMEKTRKHFWFPLKVYAIAVFILIYVLNVFVSFKRWLSSLIDLQLVFGYSVDASMLENIWESLAVLIVVVLYSYERRQSKYLQSVAGESPEYISFSFIKRLLIWHCEKILSLSVLYASMSPISASGFVYLLGLVLCSTFPKSSRIPSKCFMCYSGFLLMINYLFQMFGEKAKMLPGQTYSNLPILLGLRLFKPGFSGLESGLRAKVLVIVACVLQYNVFFWLENMPREKGHGGKWEEPCGLFNLMDDTSRTSIYAKESEPTAETSPLFRKKNASMNSSWPSFDVSTEVLEDKKNRYSRHIWGSSSFKWNRKWLLLWRKERLDMQIATLKIYMKVWIENAFNLFGLEINMIALLLASFATLNSISLLYVTALAVCILVPRQNLQRFWPLFVLAFASVLILEYWMIWMSIVDANNQFPISQYGRCHDCWRNSSVFVDFCRKCWLGIVVDDPRMLISYYMVFVLSCFKLRADHMSGHSACFTYWETVLQRKRAAAFSDLSFETKNMWTFLDRLRLYSYFHLLDLVLALILITGTLEYDVLHLGYLGFALAFFRLRLKILKERNNIFKFLRIYNFSLIVLSLAYQSPFVGDSNEGKCETADYLHEVIGFYKYDYGFRITSRSALVEIIIFMLVSLQSHIFSSQDFDSVSKYIEADQMDALVREQQKRAAWKTAQLQHIRKSEEEKRLRNLQVENIKSEMLNLQIHLRSMSTDASLGSISSGCGDRHETIKYNPSSSRGGEEHNGARHEVDVCSSSLFPLDTMGPLKRMRSGSRGFESMHHSVNSLHDIPELRDTIFTYASPKSDEYYQEKPRSKVNLLFSAVHLVGDGVSQARSLGKKAVSNLVHFFDIEDELELHDCSYEDENEIYYELENQNIGFEPVEQAHSFHSESEQTESDATTYLQIGLIFRYIWAQMRSNNEILCYFCFILIFLWNFSLLSMVYLAALFLYALCVNTGPSYMFWTIVLIYSEVCVLLQYLYQIIIQHCGSSLISASFLQELGFPDHRIKSSFVINNMPLFLVYLFTLVQTFISAREGTWASVTEFRSLGQRERGSKESMVTLSYLEQIRRLLLLVKEKVEKIFRSLLWYWRSVTQGAETPPYFVQLSMAVEVWPDDGIQPERIESSINKLLTMIADIRSDDSSPNGTCLPSKVRIQSIERSPENPSVALAVFEVVFAYPHTGSHPIEFYKPLTPAADVAKQILKAQHIGLFEEIGFPYPVLSVIGGRKRDIDLYAFVFCADLAVFFLVAIFYQSVIKNKSELLEVYQLEDQFPKEFVFLLMVIFFLIVIDRIIYLCSFATGKVIYYLFSLCLFTYSITKYGWGMQPSHQHAGKFALRAIYLTKAISLALQATQIRHGLPHKSTLYRQFLTSSVSTVNFMCFRVYRALPFLYELRCVLDWSCTTTSLTMYDWLKLEDIHSSLFLVKCDVDLHKAKHRQGEKQSKTTKFCNGICLFLVLLCVIWAPMLMYSSGNPTNIANPIQQASVQIDLRTITGKLTLFETTLCRILSWNELSTRVDVDPLDFLSAYSKKDIQLICCEADASSSWHVPPIVQARFLQSITNSMNIMFQWQFIRDRPKGKEVVNYELHVQDKDLPKPIEVIDVLNGTSSNFRIFNVYPRYFRVTGSGDVRLIEQAVNYVSGDLILNRDDPQWWSFHDTDISDRINCGDFAGPVAVIVSEETPQGIIGDTLSKFSIWGLYITFVLAVGRFIRLQCSDLRMRIPFENLPNCDRLIAICEDIYAARAEGELEVEEVLYWTLVKVYRSPHMLLEYTKID